MRQPVLFGVATLLLASCGGSVIDGDANSVWVKRPFLNLGSTLDAAEEHCGRYGKQAIVKAGLVGNMDDWRNARQRSNFTPIDVYDCE